MIVGDCCILPYTEILEPPMRFSAYMPQQSMHPILRVLMILAGAAVLATLIIFGAVALLAMFVLGGVTLAVQRWRTGHGKPPSPAHPAKPTDSRVLEGEYVVVDRERPS